MEIVKFKREQEHHLAHINRIRNIKPVLNTDTPESLGLNHLAYRPKKMQLIEDRRQTVAKENAKLMELMTNIMNEKRSQPKHIRPLSLNEVERKREVDRLNFENQLMASRLNRVAPVINNKQFERDFKHHLKAEANLRRKQMKPLALPKDLHPNSPLRKTTSTDEFTHTSGALFNSGLYVSQKGQHLQGTNIDALRSFETEERDGSIRSVTDFRKQVIAPKKMNGGTYGEIDSNDRTGNIEKLLSVQGRMNHTRNETLYEVAHSPS